MAPAVLLECSEIKAVKRRSFTVMMGKSQKLSRGLSTSFDYRHAVETMGESQRYGGGSSHVDSQDSCTPKRKGESLNRDRGDCFNVPLQAISFLKMSGFERKEMELRLRVELEQVQRVQRKVASRSVGNVGGVALSSSSNGHGKKMSSNGSQLKRGSSGKCEYSKQRSQPSVNNSNPAIMKQCESILSKLRTHQLGWVFNTPVNAVALNIPDYYTVIKHPMDFGTIKNKLTSGAYTSPRAFVADVRLTFTNAMTYNPPGNDVHIMADKLGKFFESKWKPIEKKLVPSNSSAKRETGVPKEVLLPKRRKTSPVRYNIIPEKVIPRVTLEERQRLSNCLATMIDDMPDHITDFLRQHIRRTNESGEEEEIEVDIDVMSDEELLELKKLLDDYLLEKKSRRPEKAEPSQMELLDVSGPSNSTKLPGNEPAEEDVDIGGNDPPIASFPQVKIEKDPTVRNNKFSSSSSDSSSSTDSDSGGSSRSESGERDASPAKTAKGNIRPELVQDEVKRDTMDLHDKNRTVGGLDQTEQDVHPDPPSFEADGHQEGESAPDRQISPEKVYRTALLKSRFADTILKAHEKALDQGEKGGPEKLQQEREVHERQQREAEKARLQAEAKAVVAARRRAEAEAAAEAKRKREVEREAARQALLKIEKTVEINGNCLVLKDLEMLGTGQGEHLSSSVDETSPDQSLDGMGTFKIGEGNPLEQLGLYMKEDDEDEEEAVTRPSPVEDVEEGEVD